MLVEPTLNWFLVFHKCACLEGTDVIAVIDFVSLSSSDQAGQLPTCHNVIVSNWPDNPCFTIFLTVTSLPGEYSEPRTGMFHVYSTAARCRLAAGWLRQPTSARK